MNINDNILLIFPPAFYPYMPYLALPSISSVLSENNINHKQIDLNVLFYNYLLQQEFLSDAYKKIRSISSKRSLTVDQKRRIELTSHPSMSHVIDLIPKALDKIQGNSCKLPKEIDPWKVLTLGLDIISDSYYPEVISFSGYKTIISPKSSKQLIKYINQDMLYFEPCSEIIHSNILSFKPSVIAFSITVPDQIIPVLGLSNFIRTEFPYIKIVWGGNIPTRLASIFTKKNHFSNLYDAVVISEGENIIIDVLTALQGNRELHDYSRRVFQAQKSNYRIDNHNKPNFDGLTLKSYFDRKLTLPYQASRRCYWEKCQFCDISVSYLPEYRWKSPSKVVDDIEILIKQYGTKYIKFTDDSLSPKLLKDISKEIINRGLEVYWEAYVLFEKEFVNQDFCNILYKAGCRWLYFGLESGNDTTVKKMQKGNKEKLSSKIIRSVSSSGIKIHVWIIIGFPTESKEDVQKTIDYVIKHSSYISSIEVNQFALTKHSPIIKSDGLTQFGVKPIIRQDEDLALVYDYEVETGLSQEEAKALTFEVRNIFKKELGFPDVVRSSLLSHD